MKINKLVIFTIAMLAISQAQSEPAMPGSQTIEVHPTAWVKLELKGADKDLASKIAAQITANPKNAARLVAALIAANPDHATAITTAALVTLDAKSAPMITATAVNAAPNSAAAITKAAVAALPNSAAAITTAAVNAAPSFAQAITMAAVSAAPQATSNIVTAVVGLITASANRNFSEPAGSESTTSNSAIKRNIITSDLENKLKECSSNQCKIDAAVAAVNQGGNSPDLVASIAGEVIKTVITSNPNLEQTLTLELKNTASPS